MQDRLSDKTARLWLSAGFAALMAKLISSQLPSLDFGLATAVFGAPLDWKPVGQVASTALLAVLAVAAATIGYRLKPVVRVLAAVQLAVVALAIQYACVALKLMPAAPLATLSSILLACIAGWGLRAYDLHRRAVETQYIELKLRNEELQRSRLSLVRNDEAERRLLAADLHDQVLNDLKTVVWQLETHRETPDQTKLDKAISQLHRTMTDIREIMDSLCPTVLEHFGLAAAIEECLDKGAARSGFEVRFFNDAEAGTLESLSAVEQQLLYRLVQESITNVCKHAQASLVSVRIRSDNRTLTFSVQDDGVGVDPAKVSQASRGLLYMRLRANLIGANVAWTPGANNKGTLVEISLPLPSARAAASQPQPESHAQGSQS